MWIIATAARAEHIPKQVMQLAGIQQAAALRNKHECFMYRVPDQNVFFRRDLATANKLGPEFFIMNLDSTNSEMASNLVIVHRRTELISVSIAPQSRILH